MIVLLYLLVPVLLAGVVIGISVFRNRRPTSLEAGMKEFQAGLDALNPETSRRNGDSRRK